MSFPNFAEKLSGRSWRSKAGGAPAEEIEYLESGEYSSKQMDKIDHKLAARFSFIESGSDSIERVLSNSSDTPQRSMQPAESQFDRDWSFPIKSKRNSTSPSRPKHTFSHSRAQSLATDLPARDMKRRSLADLMCSASKVGDVPQIGRLLGAGADPKKKSKEGLSPIHLAAAGGHLNVVKTLIMHGARVDVKDSLGRTPLHCAVMGRHPSVISFLVYAGASLEAKDNDGRTAIDMAEEQSAEQPMDELEPEPTRTQRLRFSYNFEKRSHSRQASASSISSNPLTPLEALLQASTGSDNRKRHESVSLDRAAQASELRMSSDKAGPNRIC